MDHVFSFFACVCWPVPFAKVSPWKTFRRPTLGCTTIWSPSCCRASHLPTIEKIPWWRLDSTWLWKKILPDVFLFWDITVHHVLVLLKKKYVYIYIHYTVYRNPSKRSFVTGKSCWASTNPRNLSDKQIGHWMHSRKCTGSSGFTNLYPHIDLSPNEVHEFWPTRVRFWDVTKASSGRAKLEFLFTKYSVGLGIDLATGQNWYIKGKGPSPLLPPEKIDTINNDPPPWIEINWKGIDLEAPPQLKELIRSIIIAIDILVHPVWATGMTFFQSRLVDFAFCWRLACGQVSRNFGPLVLIQWSFFFLWPSIECVFFLERCCWVLELNPEHFSSTLPSRSHVTFYRLTACPFLFNTPFSPTKNICGKTKIWDEVSLLHLCTDSSTHCWCKLSLWFQLSFLAHITTNISLAFDPRFSSFNMFLKHRPKELLEKIKLPMKFFRSMLSTQAVNKKIKARILITGSLAALEETIRLAKWVK